MVGLTFIQASYSDFEIDEVEFVKTTKPSQSCRKTDSSK